MTIDLEARLATSGTSTEGRQACLALSAAIRQLRSDGLSFDYCIYTQSNSEKPGSEASYIKQLEQANDRPNAAAERKALTRSYRTMRVALLGKQLATAASLMDLQGSMRAYCHALTTVASLEADVLSDLTAVDLLQYMRSTAGYEVHQLREALLTCDWLRYLRFQAGGAWSQMTGLSQENLHHAYHEFHTGTIKSIKASGSDFEGGKASPFINWRECRNPLVGSHLLAMHRELYAQYGFPGPDHWISPELEYPYNSVNEPQYQERRLGILTGDEAGKSLAVARLDMAQMNCRAFYLGRVDHMQNFLGDLRKFETALRQFIHLHKQSPQLDVVDKDRAEPDFEQLAAKSNLIMAVRTLPGITKLHRHWRKQMAERHLPRAKPIRPLIPASVSDLAKQWETALSAITSTMVEEGQSGRILAAGLRLVDTPATAPGE